MKYLLFAAPLLALSAPLSGQATPPAAPKGPPGQANVSLVKAGSYKVDTGHTQVLWQVNHLGFSKFDGQFGGITGTMQLDPRQPSATRLSITIPMSGMTTTVGALTDHLRRADFFDVAKYPTATFTSTAVRVSGQTARISGNLMLHGVTRPVVLDARFIGAGPGMMPPKSLNVGFEATTTIKRSEFGMGTGVPMVGDEVLLRINAAFERVG